LNDTAPRAEFPDAHRATNPDEVRRQGDSQYNDLAAKMPDKLNQMRELFYAEATKNQVFPKSFSLITFPDQKFDDIAPSATA